MCLCVRVCVITTQSGNKCVPVRISVNDVLVKKSLFDYLQSNERTFRKNKYV